MKRYGQQERGEAEKRKVAKGMEMYKKERMKRMIRRGGNKEISDEENERKVKEERIK